MLIRNIHFLMRAVALAATIVVASSVGVAAQTPTFEWYTSHSGNPNEPYVIRTGDDLAGLALIANNYERAIGVPPTDEFTGKTILLDNNIDISGYGANYNEGRGWIPIGRCNWNEDGICHDYSGFRGTFDVQGYEINGLYIRDSDQRYVGLFASIYNGSVRNLGVINIDIDIDDLSRDYVIGGVVAIIINGNIESCYSTGIISGDNYSRGGMVGLLHNSNVKNSYSTCNTGNDHPIYATGGVAGIISGGNIENCYSTGNVSSVGGSVGSILGLSRDNNSVITNCAALSNNVTATGWGSGGLIIGYDVDATSTCTNNAAFAGMTLTDGNTMITNHTTTAASQGVTELVTPLTLILDNGTIGNRFTAPIWTTDCNSLPGLGHLVPKPAHLQFNIDDFTFAINPNNSLIYTGAPFIPDEITATYRNTGATQQLQRGIHYTYITTRNSENVNLPGGGTNVGAYTVEFNFISCVPVPIPNVAVSYTITPRPITVTANPGQSKISGDPDPVFMYTSSDFEVSFMGALSRRPGEAVGTYQITQGTLIADSNYNITFVGTDFEILRRITGVVVTVHADQSKVYGDADPVFTYTSSMSALVFTGDLSRVAGNDIGTYTINQGTLDAAGNEDEGYNITFVPAVFTITPRPVTVTVNSGQSKVYGDLDPPFTYSVSSPLVSGDVFIGALGRMLGEGTGMYPITQSTLDVGSNYNITFVGADFEVIPRTVVVIVDIGQSKVYGDADPAFTYMSSIFEVSFTGALNRMPGENVGLYAITPGTLSVEVGHVIDFVGGFFEIKPITCTDIDSTRPFIPVTDIVADLPDAVELGTPVYLFGTVIPDNATNRMIIWSVEASRSTGAFIRNDTLYTRNVGTGPIIVRATVQNGREPCEDFVKDFHMDIFRTTRPQPTSGYNSGYISVGPNPARPFGTMKIYHTGGRIVSGKLFIVNAMGNIVKEVMIESENHAVDENIRREIASWNLTNEKGRHVAAGVYLLTGTVNYNSGRIEVKTYIGVTKR